MSMLVRVHQEAAGDVPVGVVEGEVDSSTSAEIHAALRSLLTNRSTTLIVDLTGTGYLDSAGVNLLFALDAELRQRQQRLRVVVVPASPIARMLAITGLDRTVPMHATRADALEQTRPPRSS